MAKDKSVPKWLEKAVGTHRITNMHKENQRSANNAGAPVEIRSRSGKTLKTYSPKGQAIKKRTK